MRLRFFFLIPFLFFLIIIFSQGVNAATNLVSNPSFEGKTWQIDENNTNFEDWDISRYPHNGIIKTWVETSNTKSGSKAFHWRTEAPYPTNISFSYYTNISKKFVINESNYLEAGLWAYVISGSTGDDITLHFWSENGTYLGRFWGQDKLGGWALNEWKRVSYLWFPSSLGEGNGYIPKGAKYARLHIYANWHQSGVRERIDDNVFVRQYDHFPDWIERLEKNFTNIKLIADYNKFQGISNLSYGAHISPYMTDFFTGGPNQTLWNIVKQFNFTHMRFQYPGFESCKYWNETSNSCDKRITHFEDWEISEDQNNGVIKTWLETINIKSGNKAFHHYTEAPSPTNISFSYYSVFFPIDENKYYEAGFWSYPIQGSRSYDVSMYFYDEGKNFLARRWGRDILGSFSLKTWGRMSSLWYPSSLGQGNGYIEKGARYARLNIYINWHVSGVKEAIDDDIFVREFDHLPNTTERQSEVVNNLVSNPSFEGRTSEGYNWNRLDKAITAIKGVGAEPIIALPAGTWGNGNYMPKNFPLNYSLHIIWDRVLNWTGYLPALDAYCEYAKAIVNHLNVERGYDVKYWEIGNEIPVWNSTVAEYYIDLFNSVEKCMHSIDPEILLTSDNSLRRDFGPSFVKHAENVGFLSFHYYESGGTCMWPYNITNTENIFYPPNDKNGWDRDITIMNRVNDLSSGGYTPREIKEIWKRERGKDLEIIATEINLNSAWKNGTDHRQNNIFGATWYAAKAKAYILDGATSALNYFTLMSWDRVQPMAKYGGFGFGMMNSSYPYNPYAPYWTNYLLTKYIPKGSKIYFSKSSDSDIIDILSVESRNSKNILLINKANETVNFTLPILGFTIKNATLHLLDKTTYVQKYEPLLDRTIIYKSSIESIPLPKDNVQTFTFNGYTVAVLEAFEDPDAPYLKNITNIDLKSVTWNQNKYYVKSECDGVNTIQVYSKDKPKNVKMNNIIVNYDSSLTTIPSWNYDLTSKTVTIKFSC
jgi:hypothetical protein